MIRAGRETTSSKLLSLLKQSTPVAKPLWQSIAENSGDAHLPSSLVKRDGCYDGAALLMVCYID
jgi:hypothetical protein